MNETEQLRQLLKEAIMLIKELNGWIDQHPETKSLKQESLLFADRALPHATLTVTPPNDKD